MRTIRRHVSRYGGGFSCYLWDTMSDTPRHLVCSAVRPAGAATFDHRWRSETAVALARGIAADHALDRLPILADAIEEAGCDDLFTLRHCRECRDHTVHCWVLVDLLDLPITLEPAPVTRMTDYEVEREVERVTGRSVSRDSPESGTFGPLLGKLLGLLALFAFAIALKDQPWRTNKPAQPFGPRPNPPPTIPLPFGR